MATATARNAMLIYVLFIAMPVTQAAVPGTFFWRPRVGLDIAVPTNFPRSVKKPTIQNVQRGVAVVIQGYQMGLTVAAIAAIVEKLQPYPHLSPLSAYYYTDMYRWALRHLSLIPEWLGDSTKKYVETHKVWRKRYFFMDKFVPEWIRKMLFFVPKDEWKKEEAEWARFVKYAEPAFGKYYRYPSKRFNDYASFQNKDSVENLDITDASLQK